MSQGKARLSASVNTFIPGTKHFFPFSLDLGRISSHELLGGYCPYLTNLASGLSV